MKNREKVYQLVSRIPKGKVSTYKQIAKLSGIKNPRLIGNILHVNKNPTAIPCHRVVKSNGTLAEGYAFGGKEEQKRKLKSEGIEFKNNRIDLTTYLFKD